MDNKNDKTIIEFEESDGAIVFKKDGLEEQYIIPTTDDVWANSVRQTIAFFIYATQRLDWMIEFQSTVGKILDEELKIEVEEKKKKDRSHLKIVK